jgi:hypothetical protein
VFRYDFAPLVSNPSAGTPLFYSGLELAYGASRLTFRLDAANFDRAPCMHRQATAILIAALVTTATAGCSRVFVQSATKRIAPTEVKVDGPWWDASEISAEDLIRHASASPPQSGGEALPSAMAQRSETPHAASVPGSDATAPRPAGPPAPPPPDRPFSIAAAPAVVAPPSTSDTVPVRFRPPAPPARLVESTVSSSVAATPIAKTQPATEPAESSGPAVADQAVPIEPPNMQLLGVITDAQGESVAMLREPGGASHTVRVGGTMTLRRDGQSRSWSIREIAAGRVVATDGEQTVVIR